MDVTKNEAEVMLQRRALFFRAIEAELLRAYKKHGAEKWGRHEFYAILLEEMDEIKDVVWHNGAGTELFNEMVSVAAMCVRYFETGGNRLSTTENL